MGAVPPEGRRVPAPPARRPSPAAAAPTCGARRTPRVLRRGRADRGRPRSAPRALAAALAAAGAALAAVRTAGRGFVGPSAPRSRGHLVPRRWFLPGWGNDDKGAAPEGDAQERSRFWSYAEGEGDAARLQRDALRDLLECTDAFCLTKRWLPDAFVDSIYRQYSHPDGITVKDFDRLACDGLLLSGKLDEYEKAFAALDQQGAGTGLLTREAVGRLFAGLGQVMAPEELDRILDESDVDHDGLDFADFLGLARTHLDLAEVLRYFETHPQPEAGLPVDLASPEFTPAAGLGEVTTVHGEAELNAIVKNGADAVVKLAFTWCRPCKTFWPKYQRFAQVYSGTRFLKIVGNDNESCKHYAREVLKAKISPMFAVYSGGELVDTWHGANVGRFVERMERGLPSAGARAAEREAAAAKEPMLAAAPAPAP